MEKIKVFEHYNGKIDWYGETSIKEIKEDVLRLEKEGVTHIDVQDSECYIERLETDEEFEKRKLIAEKISIITREKELTQLARLKEKYETI